MVQGSKGRPAVGCHSSARRDAARGSGEYSLRGAARAPKILFESGFESGSQNTLGVVVLKLQKYSGSGPARAARYPCKVFTTKLKKYCDIM